MPQARWCRGWESNPRAFWALRISSRSGRKRVLRVETVAVPRSLVESWQGHAAQGTEFRRAVSQTLARTRHPRASAAEAGTAEPSRGMPCYPVGMPMPVLSHAQVVDRLSECEPEIRALGVRRLALFGSVLRGNPRADSDADVLVQFAPGAKSYARFLALSELLESRLGRTVELVTTEALSPFIGPRILTEAQDVLRAA